MQDKKTILYVDDYADNRRLLQRILESEGYIVVQAPDGTEALKRLSEGSLDLALIDLHLPDTTGYELGARVREFPGYKSLPIIFVTAGDHDQAARIASPGLYDTFIQKPFELDFLLTEIRLKLGLAPDKKFEVVPGQP